MHSHQVRDIELRDHRHWSVDTLRGANNGSGFDSTVGDLLQSVLGGPGSPTSNSYSSRRNYLEFTRYQQCQCIVFRGLVAAPKSHALFLDLTDQRIRRGTFSNAFPLEQTSRGYLPITITERAPDIETLSRPLFD